MATKRKSFVIHIDSLDILDELNDEQAGKLLKAIKAYHKDEDLELDFTTKLAFSQFKNQFIRDDEKYQKICERNKANGKKGGRPEQTNNNQEVTNKTKANPKNPNKPTGLSGNPKNPNKPDSDNDSDSDSDSDSEINNKDLATSKKQPCWDYEKVKAIWNEEKSNSDCPATGCNIVPDSLKSGLLKVHKKYITYCKTSGKTELERHEWFRAYAKGHLKRCSTFVGKSDNYSWKPSIKDLGQVKTFEALINQ